jgi:hypothetical protein
MKYSISRCTKPPGLIIRALTYYLELNEKGLYLICLGNATAQPVTHDIISAAIADGAVKFFDNRYEKQIKKNEEQLLTLGAEKMVNTRHSHFFELNTLKALKVSQLTNGMIQIEIKGPKKIKLQCHPHFHSIALSIAQTVS